MIADSLDCVRQGGGTDLIARGWTGCRVSAPTGRMPDPLDSPG